MITVNLFKNVFLENASVMTITMMVAITPTDVHMIEIAAHLSNAIKDLASQKISLAFQVAKTTKHARMEFVMAIMTMDADMMLTVINLKLAFREFVFQTSIDLVSLLAEMIKHAIMESVFVMDADQTMIVADLKDAIKEIVFQLIFVSPNADLIKLATMEYVYLQIHPGVTQTMIVLQDGNAYLVTVFKISPYMSAGLTEIAHIQNNALATGVK